MGPGGYLHQFHDYRLFFFIRNPSIRNEYSHKPNLSTHILPLYQLLVFLLLVIRVISYSYNIINNNVTYIRGFQKAIAIKIKDFFQDKTYFFKEPKLIIQDSMCMIIFLFYQDICRYDRPRKAAYAQGDGPVSCWLLMIFVSVMEHKKRQTYSWW